MNITLGLLAGALTGALILSAPAIIQLETTKIEVETAQSLREQVRTEIEQDVMITREITSLEALMQKADQERIARRMFETSV